MVNLYSPEGQDVNDAGERYRLRIGGDYLYSDLGLSLDTPNLSRMLNLSGVRHCRLSFLNYGVDMLGYRAKEGQPYHVAKSEQVDTGSPALWSNLNINVANFTFPKEGGSMITLEELGGEKSAKGINSALNKVLLSEGYHNFIGGYSTRERVLGGACFAFFPTVVAISRMSKGLDPTLQVMIMSYAISALMGYSSRSVGELLQLKGKIPGENRTSLFYGPEYDNYFGLMVEIFNPLNKIIRYNRNQDQSRNIW